MVRFLLGVDGCYICDESRYFMRDCLFRDGSGATQPSRLVVYSLAPMGRGRGRGGTPTIGGLHNCTYALAREAYFKVHLMRHLVLIDSRVSGSQRLVILYDFNSRDLINPYSQELVRVVHFTLGVLIVVDIIWSDSSWV